MYQDEDIISVKVFSCLKKIAKMKAFNVNDCTFSSVLGMCLILRVLNPYMNLQSYLGLPTSIDVIEEHFYAYNPGEATQLFYHS